MVVVEDGYHIAVIENFKLKKDGTLELHFNIDGQRVKARLSDQEKIRKLYKLLTGITLKEINRSLLKLLIGVKCIVKTETRQFENAGYTITYSRVTEIKRYSEEEWKKLQEENEDDSFYTELLDRYIRSSFGFIDSW